MSCVIHDEIKGKEKEKGPYQEQLNCNIKQWYLDKLVTINYIDPYDPAAQDWITAPDALPPLTYWTLSIISLLN